MASLFLPRKHFTPNRRSFMLLLWSKGSQRVQPIVTFGTSLYVEAHGPTDAPRQAERSAFTLK
jgi:hypothetical protein